LARSSQYVLVLRLSESRIEDRNENGIWRVEYFDDDGGCYVTIFAGPGAELRAREYYDALQSGKLNAITVIA
jgi:hypothetical protein